MSQLADVLAARAPDLLRRWEEAVWEVTGEAGLQPSLAEVRRVTDFVAAAVAEAVDEAKGATAQRTRPPAESPASPESRGSRVFESLVEASDDYIAIINLQGQVVYMNPAGLRLAGFASLEQARATPIADMAPAAFQDVLRREVLAEALAGKSWEGEAPLRSLATGEIIPLAARTIPLRGAEGRVELLGTINRDIRERKAQETERARLHAEAERLRILAETESARLNALFMRAPVSIAVIRGPRLVVEVANPSVLRLWGRTAEQVVGKPLEEALPELSGRGFDALLRGVLDTGEPFSATEMQLPLGRGEGGALEMGYFNFVYQPLPGAHGRTEAVCTIAVDVTETVQARQKVEELLLRSQRAERARGVLLEALGAQTLVGVSYVGGAEPRFKTANSVYQHLMGRDVVGEPARRVLPELEGQEFFTRMLQVLETGVPWVGREVSVQVARDLTGTERELLIDFTHQPVRALDGSIDGVLSLVLEVTEQVRLRQEAQRMEAAQRQRSDFEQHLIGIVSHDLRNPLNAILLGLHVLLQREPEARTRQSLLRLQSSTERAVRLVRDLLDFTQARLGGGLKVSRAPTDLHALVRGVVEENEVTHPARRIHLEQRGEGHGVCDADRIAQVVGNLLGNALKYSPADSPVTVRSLGEAEQVRLEVHNGGVPIPAEALARLFQPLQRAVEGTDPVGRSVGLGLYIVEQIVRAHGGDVHVTSTAAGGTTFSVRLPRGT